MKRTLWIGPVVLVAACTAWADAPAPAAGGKDAGAGDAKAHLRQLRERLVQVVAPTDKQAPALKEALDAYEKDFGAWMEKTGPRVLELRGQAKGIHSGGDAKAMAAARDAMTELGKIQEEEKQKRVALLANLRTILTPEQLVKARQVVLPQEQQPHPMNSNVPFHLLMKLGLTEKQLTDARKIIDAARADANVPADANKAGDPMQRAWDRIVGSVLTDDQRQQLEKLQEDLHRSMVLNLFRNLQLTKEQVARMEKIWVEARDKAKAKPADRHDLYRRAQMEILEKVLTDAQREQLKKPQPTMPPGHPPMGGGAGHP